MKARTLLASLAFLTVDATSMLHARDPQTVYQTAPWYNGDQKPAISVNYADGSATVSFSCYMEALDELGVITTDVDGFYYGYASIRANGTEITYGYFSFGGYNLYTGVYNGASISLSAFVENAVTAYNAGTAYDVSISMWGIMDGNGWTGDFVKGPSYMPERAHRTLTVSGPPSGYTGTTYQFNASPNAGGGTITWSDDGRTSAATGSTATYNWPTDGNKTISATISGDLAYEDATGSTTCDIGQPSTHSVTVNVSPAGAGSGSASANPSSGINDNGFSDLSATAAPGWQFSSWVFSGVTPNIASISSITSPNSSLTGIYSNITVTANFTLATPNVTITPSSTAVTVGQTVTFSVYAYCATGLSEMGLESSDVSGTAQANLGNSGVSGNSVTCHFPWTPSATGTYYFLGYAWSVGRTALARTSPPVAITVTPKPVTFTFGNLTHTYDGSLKTATVTCSDPAATFTADLTKGPNAGNYPVSATAYGNYEGSGSDTLTINPAGQTVEITPSDSAIIVGQSITFTASGGQNGYVWGGSASGAGASNTVNFPSAGTFTVTVYSPAGGNYSESNTATATITVTQTEQTTLLTLDPLTPQTYGTSRTFTVGGGDGSGAISDALAGGPATRTGTLTYTADSGTTGYTVTVTKEGDATYLAQTGTFTIPVVKADQTISFGALANKTNGDAPFAVSATATSGLPVTFSLVSGPATVSDSTVTITGAGTVTIRASQGGDANYNTAPSVDQTFTVAKGAQPTLLALNAATPQTYGTTQTLTTTGGNGTGAVSYAITGQSAAGVATLAGTDLTANAGTGWVDLQATKAGDTNYLSATSATQRVIFQPKTVMPSVTAADKIYDGTTAATITGRSLTGVVGADDATLTGGTPAFASKTVGAGKTMTATGLALTGAKAGNYTLATTTATTTAAITPRTLNVTGITANNKVYDGNTAATLNLGGAVLNGVISGDTVSLVTTGAVGTFSDKNAGTGKTVAISGLTLGGADAGNYTLVQPTTTADITTRGSVSGLVVVGITANNKVYDGNTVASLNLGSVTLSGVLSGDSVSLNTSGASGAFGDKNVGAGKTVTISGLTLAGPDAGNYSLTPPPTTTASITPATPTITWGAPAAITYGTRLTAVQLNATASVPGVLTYTPAANTLLNAGAGQTLLVNFVPTDTTNYTNASATTTLTINKADQIVTLTPLTSAVPLGTPIGYTATGSATGLYVWGGTAGASGGGTTQTVTPSGGLGGYTVTVYSPGDSNYNDSPPVTAMITAQAQTLTLSLTPLVSNYTVDNASSPLNGKTYKRVWQDGGTWHAYLARSGVQFQIVGQATAAVQAFALQALEPNADPSAWYALATIAPPTGAPNGPGVSVTGVFSVSLDTGSAGASLVPQSYAQGNPKTGVWQLRARTQDSSGTWSGWSNVVAVTVDLPLTTKAVPAQSLPPAGPIGGWFTASDQTTFNLPVWIP